MMIIRLNKKLLKQFLLSQVIILISYLFRSQQSACFLENKLLGYTLQISLCIVITYNSKQTIKPFVSGQFGPVQFLICMVGYTYKQENCYKFSFNNHELFWQSCLLVFNSDGTVKSCAIFQLFVKWNPLL